jgi:hypothetical protein
VISASFALKARRSLYCCRSHRFSVCLAPVALTGSNDNSTSQVSSSATCAFTRSTMHTRCV